MAITATTELEKMLPKESPIEGDDEVGMALVQRMEFGDDLRLSIRVRILQPNHFHSHRTTTSFVGRVIHW